MVAPALLESVRTLSVPDKLALIEAISQMLQDELRSRAHINGRAKAHQSEKNLPEQPQPDAWQGNQDIKAMIAELLSRPDPTPEQMLPYGIWEGVQFDEEDFRAAEWHPSDKELLGE